ncbi:ParB N-terminal domain-containing protein [Streptomyces sp. NPDC102274]|uniref:ParB/RepB/Spo0J family partition protein n=1 Tax=Streptomyces sp. NPDC102274 TaxID=3366151 RepID=UPI0038079A8B
MPSTSIGMTSHTDTSRRPQEHGELHQGEGKVMDISGPTDVLSLSICWTIRRGGSVMMLQSEKTSHARTGLTDQSSPTVESDDRLNVITLEIAQILPADSPRLEGVNEEYVQLIAEVEEELPPITVHSVTRRVVDGMHRLRAAVERGDKTIKAILFSGSEDEAFVHSVTANNAHGLPLTAADRRAAASRVLRAHPSWSDRAIASAVGVSAHTVAKIRHTTVGADQRAIRIGRDGRSRPLSTAEGRRRAGELMKARPDTPLREIASEVGLSVGTVSDVRRRLRQGEDPVIPTAATKASTREKIDSAANKAHVPSTEELQLAWKQLSKDPSLHMNDRGRLLLVLMRAFILDDEIAYSLPPHCAERVSLLARNCSVAWHNLAEALETRRG